jgi:predicted histidine transporter YuiF (NhaC family)
MPARKKGKLLERTNFLYSQPHFRTIAIWTKRAADCGVNRLNWLVSVLSAHWLSLLLVAGLVVAIWFVYKHKNKYAKNEFE